MGKGENYLGLFVVDEFPNMFPKDLPRLTLDRESEFYIDLVLGNDLFLSHLLN